MIAQILRDFTAINITHGVIPNPSSPNRSCTLILMSVWKTETKMGTYTSNYNLFMPSVGEQGWGDLVNGNFTTIDATMKGLSNDIGTLETEADAAVSRIATLETLPTYFNGTKSLKLSYSGTYAITCGKGHWNTASFTSVIPIISSPIPLTGKVSLKKSDDESTATLYCTGKNGSSTNALTITQTEYAVTNVYTIFVYVKNNGSDSATITIGRPIVNT